MRLPYAVFKRPTVSTIGVQPLLRIGVPAGTSLHLKYIKVDMYDGNPYTISLYINGILNTIFSMISYGGDFPFDVILPEFTQIRIDVDMTTKAGTILNVALVGDTF